jgi:hypothetical protein
LVTQQRRAAGAALVERLARRAFLQQPCARLIGHSARPPRGAAMDATAVVPTSVAASSSRVRAFVSLPGIAA